MVSNSRPRPTSGQAAVGRFVRCSDRGGGNSSGSAHLAAVRRRHDPRGAMHVHPNVLRADHQRLTRVGRHADAHDPTIGPGRACEQALSISRCRDCIARSTERDKERIACSVDLLPGMPSYRSSSSERAASFFGTTMRHASKTSSRSSSSSIRSRRTSSHWKRAQIGRPRAHELVRERLERGVAFLLGEREAHFLLVLGEREIDDLSDAELDPAADDDLVGARQPRGERAHVVDRHRHLPHRAEIRVRPVEPIGPRRRKDIEIESVFECLGHVRYP